MGASGVVVEIPCGFHQDFSVILWVSSSLWIARASLDVYANSELHFGPVKVKGSFGFLP